MKNKERKKRKLQDKEDLLLFCFNFLSFNMSYDIVIVQIINSKVIKNY